MRFEGGLEKACEGVDKMVGNSKVTVLSNSDNLTAATKMENAQDSNLRKEHLDRSLRNI